MKSTSASSTWLISILRRISVLLRLKSCGCFTEKLIVLTQRKEAREGRAKVIESFTIWASMGLQLGHVTNECVLEEETNLKPMRFW